MQETIEFGGKILSADDLVARGSPTSWPDVFSTDVGELHLRWQFANEKGPCRKLSADRLLIPFAHGAIPNGAQLRLKVSHVIR